MSRWEAKLLEHVLIRTGYCTFDRWKRITLVFFVSSIVWLLYEYIIRIRGKTDNESEWCGCAGWNIEMYMMVWFFYEVKVRALRVRCSSRYVKHFRPVIYFSFRRVHCTYKWKTHVCRVRGIWEKFRKPRSRVALLGVHFSIITRISNKRESDTMLIK